MNIIKLENITKIYGGSDYQTKALDNINLIIKKGEFLSIMGPSGSGKTTLLNILGCMDIATNGEYYLNEQLVKNLSNSKLTNIRNKYISFIFQNFAIMKDYSVYENVELPLIPRNLSKKHRQKKVLYYLDKLGIKHLVNKNPNHISGGQLQRVAIARALTSESDIILADEPTGALDQKTGQELLKLLVDINKDGKTIIIITHDSKVASFTKKVINIVDGKIESEKINN